MRSFGNNKIWSHLSIETGKRTTSKDVRLSQGMKIESFRELVQKTALISNQNPDFCMFFRGQGKEYILKSGATSIYPTIFRNSNDSLGVLELAYRYEHLLAYSLSLVKSLKKEGVAGYEKLHRFPELSWSIIQHYELCPTPLLDVTHSLRVAASFALNDAQGESAFIYVLGMPYPTGTITYYTEEELINIRLLSASPPQALRPYFQEGYLVGSFPTKPEKKEPSLDFARRLVAKFEIPTSGFWSRDYHAIPKNALYPERDEMYKFCKGLVPEYS